MPIIKAELKFVGYIFVDNSDLVPSMAQSMHYQDLIWQMQQMVDSCEGSLAATSGAIVPSKTFWYLVDFFRWKLGIQENIRMPRTDNCT